MEGDRAKRDLERPQKQGWRIPLGRRAIIFVFKSPPLWALATILLPAGGVASLIGVSTSAANDRPGWAMAALGFSVANLGVIAWMHLRKHLYTSIKPLLVAGGMLLLAIGVGVGVIGTTTPFLYLRGLLIMVGNLVIFGIIVMDLRARGGEFERFLFSEASSLAFWILFFTLLTYPLLRETFDIPAPPSMLGFIGAIAVRIATGFAVKRRMA